MKVPVVVLAALMTSAMVAVTPSSAAPADSRTTLEVSSQATAMRTRPRIQVYPRYPRRNYHSLYVLPYGIDYPGPNAVRQCVSRLVPENRPSGTVIVPRMRCWWQPR